MFKGEKNKKWFVALGAVIVCLAAAGSVQAFGYSVSTSGDYVIVGASDDDDKGTNSGSAYIFKWDDTGWVQQAKLTASDGAADDWFGISVSISGDYVIVGAWYDDDNGSDSGSAYIFEKPVGGWVDATETAKLIASDGAANDYFGTSVSISEDYAIVGALRGDGNEPNSGSAYIFRWYGTSWSEQQKLLASDGAAMDFFGGSVSISGDFAIVGAYLDDDKGSGSGSAYIFKLDGTGWSQQQKLLASDAGFLPQSGEAATPAKTPIFPPLGARGARFGRFVSICGDYAIVGATAGGDDYTGSAYIFWWDGTSWSEQQKLLASDGAARDKFGYSVSISGDYAIVGAPRDDDNGTDSGSAYIFKRDGASWVQQAKLLASDGAAGNQFSQVCISGDLAIVGAYSDGSAYIFKWDGTSWVEQAKLLASDG